MLSLGPAARNLLCVLAAGSAFVGMGPRAAGQGTGTIEGTVTMVGGGGVPGVTIDLPGLPHRWITDQEGGFRLESVPSGFRELHAQIVGCSEITTGMDVPENRTVTLRLVLDGPAVTPAGPAIALAGSGTAASEAPVAYAVNRLEKEDLGRSPARSVADMIRGAFPSVKVVQGSGLPGSRLSIQIGGARSISGTEGPLLVVDGAVTGGGLDDLDPLDIESIEIRKGAAAAALYGSRGAAGVIEITTARGKPDAPTRCYLRTEPGS